MLLDDSRPYDLDRVFRLVITAATLVGLFLLVRYLAEVLIPFAVALLIAYLLNPVVAVVQRRIKNRTAAVLITVFGSSLLAVGLLVLLVPIVMDELRGLRSLADQLREQGSLLQQRIQAIAEGDAPVWLQLAIEKSREFVTSEHFLALAADAAKKLAPGIQGLLTGVYGFFAGLVGLVIVLLYLVFLLNDFGDVEGKWQNLLPPRFRGSIVGFVHDFSAVMGRYFRGQFIIAVTTGVLFAAGFWILGLRLAVVLGLGVGLLNMVPYLQLVGVIPAVLLSILHALETPDVSIWMGLLGLVIVFAAIQLIQDAILVPRIMGEVTGLRPAVMLLGVFVWGKLLGFLGLVLAIPLTGLLITYYQRHILAPSVRSSSEGTAAAEDVS